MNEKMHNDEVSLQETLNLLRHYKKLLLGLPLVCAALAVLFIFAALRPSWEASAVLDVGHVGPVVVEPIGNAVTRMMLPSFAKGAINYAGIKSDELAAMQRFYSTLKSSQVNGAELIEIKLRGPSAEMANNLIQGAIIKLQKVHNAMMAASIEKSTKQLLILTADIQKVSAETELLRNKLLASHNWNAFDATLSATLLQGKSSELRSMIQSKLALEEQLSPSRTYTTRVVDEIYVSEEPVSPNKRLIIGLAMLLGLLGAVVFAFAHNAFTSKSPQ